MSLTEPQIARYARQILLKAVGGEGQERLLKSVVRVMGITLSASTAAAYLQAGGTTVLCEAPPLGFPRGPISDDPLEATVVRARPVAPEAAKTVTEMPVAQAAGPVHEDSNAVPHGTIAVAPFTDWPAGARVLVGEEGVLSMPAGGDGARFIERTASWHAPTDEVQAGAMAALAWQRLVLGLS